MTQLEDYGDQQWGVAPPLNETAPDDWEPKIVKMTRLGEKEKSMQAEYLQHMGTDLTVVDAARVSFDKLAANYTEEQNHKLINYLAKHGHWTPFAHCIVSMRITVPFFVANQLKRHQIGFALNEVSRRYVDDEPKYYAPETWRNRPDGSIKQGSGVELSEADNLIVKDSYLSVIARMDTEYQYLLARGIAPEMARMVLPQSTYTSWWWTGSLVAWARVCKQRLDAHAQSETREVAQQINDVIEPLFPVSWRALMEG